MRRDRCSFGLLPLARTLNFAHLPVHSYFLQRQVPADLE